MNTMTLQIKLTAMTGVVAMLAMLVAPFGALAAVNEITPSTNDINQTNDWAHVEEVSVDVGEVELKFINERGFPSCFEYRTDGNTSQSTGNNYNGGITDGLYPFTCENNSSSTMTIAADEYVEVRMVFGAESDERFDWTRFDVLPEPFDASLEITAPGAGAIVSGEVDFTGVYTDEDGNDSVQWAIRAGTCAASTGTVYGNVDGKTDAASWDGENFSVTIDMSTDTPGSYCFVLNPKEDVGDTNLRATRTFVLEAPVVEPPAPTDPENKNQCKKGGWEDFGFKNQGQCVRFAETGKDSR